MASVSPAYRRRPPVSRPHYIPPPPPAPFPCAASPASAPALVGACHLAPATPTRCSRILLNSESARHAAPARFCLRRVGRRLLVRDRTGCARCGAWPRAVVDIPGAAGALLREGKDRRLRYVAPRDASSELLTNNKLSELACLALCGPQTNSRLVLNYGFVDEDNPFDRITIEASLNTEDPQYQEKRMVAQRNGKLAIQNFNVFVGKEKETVAEMLPYLRLGYISDPAEMQIILSSEGDTCPVGHPFLIKAEYALFTCSFENLVGIKDFLQAITLVSPCTERAVLDQLVGYLESRLAGYPTTLDEDEAKMVVSSRLSKLGQCAEKHGLNDTIIGCKVEMTFGRICYLFSVEITDMLIAVS
ncbi:hypothetical protein HU200_059415 [Digitaria exilis]|uniref:Rubisco LSMT substrate-binding domain-containing protein n=1 Tax=Digitaria exilis TaxID=1010633 RepID=A0A835AEE7_9POAL|nr:hypothetical protein HU200_059415 [Digitaria exilis]